MVSQTAVTHEHTLSASGGTDKVRGYGSFGFLDNQGTLKGESYTRYTAKTSIDMTPTPWFQMGINMNATYSIQQYGVSANSAGQLSGPRNIYNSAKSLFSYAVPFDENGERIIYPGGDDQVKTIVDEWKYMDNERKMFRIIGSLYAQLDLGQIAKPLKGLKYRLFKFRK